MNKCSICLGNINEENLHTTICNHAFHTEHITKWLQNKYTCPNCRTLLREDGKVKVARERILEENKKIIKEIINSITEGRQINKQHLERLCINITYYEDDFKGIR